MKSKIEKLIQMSKVADWDSTCQWAEENIPSVKEHLDTWGKHCGAPYSVYRGHIVRMVIDCYD